MKYVNYKYCFLIITLVVCTSINVNAVASDVISSNESNIFCGKNEIYQDISQFLAERLSQSRIEVVGDNHKLQVVCDDIVLMLQNKLSAAKQVKLKEKIIPLAESTGRLDREAAGLIAVSFYLCNDDLGPSYVYSKITNEPFVIISEFASRGTDDVRLSEYLVWVLLRKMMRENERFYFEGVVSEYRPVALLKCLTSLPESPVKKRFLLNYPFESSSAPMRAAYYINSSSEENAGSIERQTTMDWYLSEIIASTPYEQEFFEKLEARNMAGWVSGGKIPNATNEN